MLVKGATGCQAWYIATAIATLSGMVWVDGFCLCINAKGDTPSKIGSVVMWPISMCLYKLFLVDWCSTFSHILQEYLIFNVFTIRKELTRSFIWNTLKRFVLLFKSYAHSLTIIIYLTHCWRRWAGHETCLSCKTNTHHPRLMTRSYGGLGINIYIAVGLLCMANKSMLLLWYDWTTAACRK